MGYVEDFSFQQWQHMFNLNLHSTFLVTKYCLPKMKQTGYGRIVAVASRAALSPTPNSLPMVPPKPGFVISLPPLLRRQKPNI